MSKNNKAASWSWKISAEELKEQIENYKTLKMSQSYRGLVVLLISALLLLSLILGFFNITPLSDVVLSLIVYIPILIFVYKGHRWAIVTLGILWTVEKAYTLYLSVQTGGSPIGSIIWWFIVTPYIYKAYIVANEYRKIKKGNAFVFNGVFCTKCGSGQDIDARFCSKCGSGLIAPIE